MKKLKYNQQLPEEVETRLDAYMERVKQIQWFKPAQKIDAKDVERKVKFALDCFGVKAEVEWRMLKNIQDWDAALDLDSAWKAALDAALDAAWKAAWNLDAARSAWDAASDAAWDAASDAAWGVARSAWGVAWGVARGVAEVLVKDLGNFKKKYPNGAFINLIPLWELGLYPIGIVKGKFVIYVPPIEQIEQKFPEIS